LGWCGVPALLVTENLDTAHHTAVFQLAANMGTSVEMIELFYGKKRVREPKTATELTKVS
jgi:hypothetical protein